MRADYLINNIFVVFRYLPRGDGRMRIGVLVDDLNDLMKSLDRK